MNNTYLNLDIGDMKITTIINDLINEFNQSMSVDKFKRTIIELHNIESGELSEYDEDIVSDGYNKISDECSDILEQLLNDTTILSDGQTLGEFIRFLKYINM